VRRRKKRRRRKNREESGVNFVFLTCPSSLPIIVYYEPP